MREFVSELIDPSTTKGKKNRRTILKKVKTHKSDLQTATKAALASNPILGIGLALAIEVGVHYLEKELTIDKAKTKRRKAKINEKTRKIKG